MLKITKIHELSSEEKERFLKQLAEICPKAKLEGVVRTELGWDNRLVVSLEGEEKQSLIRFYGPDVASFPPIKNRVLGFLRNNNKDLASSILEWGEYRDEPWYRREISKDTLETKIKSNVPRLGQAKNIAQQLISIMQRYQNGRAAHAHICLSNVAIEENGKIYLIDSGVAAAQVQSAKCLGFADDIQDQIKSTFAPEVVENDRVSFDADLYGLGITLKALFEAVKSGVGDDKEKEEIDLLIDVFNALTKEKDKPSLDKIKSLLTKKEEPKKDNKPKKTIDQKIEVTKEEKKPEKSVATPAVNPFMSVKPAVPVETEKKEAKVEAAEVQAENPFANKVTPIAEAKKEEQPAENPFLGQAVPAFEETELEEAPSIIEDSFSESFDLQKPKKNPPYIFIAVLLAITIGITYYFMGSSTEESLPPIEQIAPEQYEAAWNSGIPSQMIPVALSALEPTAKVTKAEQIILKSALQDDKKLPGVNNTLIKVSFDTRWEGELRRADRRATLALAMAGLLKERMPTDLANLADLHPGVVLAVTATTNGAGGTAVLSKIPAEILTQLRLPLGYAFKLIIDGRPEMSCADQGVRSLARLVAFGLDDVERIKDFLSADGARRISVFAFMYSQDNQRAENLLNIILNDPKVNIEDPNINWGKDWGLYSWEELEASDKLFVLAGVAPSRELRPQNIGKLFSHPSRSLRTYAIEQSLDRITFRHPGAKEVFDILKENPVMLNGDDTLRLALFLENPQRVTTERIRGWLQSSPPVELISKLLLATAGEKEATKLDFEFARYLKQQNWSPDVTMLSKLYNHPDGFTRMFAYSKTYQLDDKETAYMFLQRASESENDEEFKKQILSMLEILKKDLTS